MPVTTLSDLRTKKDKGLPAFSGTGSGGATINGGQLTHQRSPAQPQTDAPKLAEQQVRKLVIQGDSFKCSIVSGHVTNHGEIRFVGNSVAPPAPQPPKVIAGVGADAVAAVTVNGSVNRSIICESLETKGIEFGDD